MYKITLLASDGWTQTKKYKTLKGIAKKYRNHVGYSNTSVSDDGVVRAVLDGCTIAAIDKASPPIYTLHYFPDLEERETAIAKVKDYGGTVVTEERSKTLSGYPICYIRYTT